MVRLAIQCPSTNTLDLADYAEMKIDIDGFPAISKTEIDRYLLISI